MRYGRYSVVLLVSLFVWLVPPVGAQAGIRRPQMTFDRALMVAVTYWAARGIDTPCHPRPVSLSSRQMRVLDRGDGVNAEMRADVDRCLVLIGPSGALLRTMGDWELRDDPPGVGYCYDVVHEVGHIDLTAAGVPIDRQHERRGVMTGDGTGHVPWACWHLERFLRYWRAGH